MVAGRADIGAVSFVGERGCRPATADRPVGVSAGARPWPGTWCVVGAVNLSYSAPAFRSWM